MPGSNMSPFVRFRKTRSTYRVYNRYQYEYVAVFVSYLLEFSKTLPVYHAIFSGYIDINIETIFRMYTVDIGIMRNIARYRYDITCSKCTPRVVVYKKVRHVRLFGSRSKSAKKNISIQSDYRERRIACVYGVVLGCIHNDCEQQTAVRHEWTRGKKTSRKSSMLIITYRA